MTAGLLHTGRIWRFTYSDDSVGGALPTGTVIYPQVFARIFTEKPTLAILEQGLEVPEMFSAILEPGNFILQHNDQFEGIGPNISPYIGKRFRIISIQTPSMIDSRHYTRIVMRRLEIANSNLLQ